MRRTVRTKLAAALLVPAAAGGQVVPFTGTRTAENIPVPLPNVGRCGAPPNTLIDGIFGAGTSSLGAFTTAESNCLNPITGRLFNGLFTFTFAGGSTLSGTATGAVVLPPVGGTTTNTFEYLITGGTGLYAGATGQLRVDGVVRFNPDGTTGNTFTYNGSFSTVPEPSAVLLLGAGLLGVAARRHRRISRASGPGPEHARRTLGARSPSTNTRSFPSRYQSERPYGGCIASGVPT